MKELTLSLLESDSCKYLVEAAESELAPPVSGLPYFGLEPEVTDP